MSKQISFPQHMRNAQAALDVLAAECKECDPNSRDWHMLIKAAGNQYLISAWAGEGTPIQALDETIEDAATALLHTIAGTEEAPF